MDYFKHLQDLLKTERHDDREAYIKLSESTSISDRRAAGIAWYPIAIKSTEPTRGDYLNVEVERKTHLDIASQIRFGNPAILFSNHDPKNDRVEGVISYTGGNNLKINLFTEELPDWAGDGKLGIELLFDNNSYDEMFAALNQASKLLEDPKNGRLVQVLTGGKQPSFSQQVINSPLAALNKSQQEAIQKIVSAHDLAIVHGPPGTGKTTTLVQAIQIMVTEFKEKVLVVAPSNTAVDLLSEQLATAGLNVLRIGNPAKVSSKLLDLNLDSQVVAHPYAKDNKRLKKQAGEYKNMAHKYKRNFGKAERDQRKALFDEAHKLMKEVAKTEQFIIDDLVGKAQVITATLVGANHYTIRNLTYDTVVIDEAGQALEPASWIPVLKANKAVFAGDHLQLSPTVKSQAALKAGLSTTLMEKCVALHPESVIMLNEQYRMNEAIMGFSSRRFYNNELTAAPAVANRLLFADDQPFLFIDTAGCGFDEKPEGTSVVNPEEAAFLFKYLNQLVDTLQLHYTVTNFPSIAVISPYSQQIRLLKEQLIDTPTLNELQQHISVNTIDSFQGQERDVVIISMTRSNTEGVIGFLSDTRRMNVAMTRAKKKLVIIGDSGTLATLPFYEQMIEYAEEAGGYKSGWEWM